MNARAYILLDISDGKSEKAVRAIMGKPGIVSVDLLDGLPDIILVVEGSSRQELADLITPILSSIDNMTEDLRLLVARDNACPAVGS